MVLLAGFVFAGATLLQAQEEPPPAPAEEAKQPATAPVTEPEPAVAADKAPSSASTPSRFEPTEKVRADFDVSFPVDI
jgi:hypothetical protein